MHFRFILFKPARATSGRDADPHRPSEPSGIRSSLLPRYVRYPYFQVFFPFFFAFFRQKQASLFDVQTRHGRTRVGCDVCSINPWKERGCFNPRTRVGCDLHNGPVFSLSWEFQSTHPRGVRRPRLIGRIVRRRFNPRTRVGCDARHRATAELWRVSIHAPAWGATRIFFDFRQILTVSIHAPAWGATSILCVNFRWNTQVSIHAPAWGATLLF